MNRLMRAAIGSSFCVVVLAIVIWSLMGHNDDFSWQVIQPPRGPVKIRDTSGYYYKGFSRVWTYPCTLKATFSNNPQENLDGIDRSIKVSFNDQGTAQVSSYILSELPTEEKERLRLHKTFQGNIDNIAIAIGKHLNNVLTISGPVMSSSENQAARKSEFNQLIEDQLAIGLFKMRRTEIELNDLVTIEEGKDADGNKVVHEKRARVQATEVVNDKETGRPIVIQKSPLLYYGICPKQFSITEIDYDKQTLEQFAARKKSYLAAEQAKAERQQEVQQRLMIEEKGRRQVAEVQADENQKKERATIQAQQAADVAEIAKRQAVTAASQKVEVADQMRQEAETLKLTAAIKAQTAELDKAATISAAEATQKAIELGGGISEEKRVLAQIAAERDIGVAQALSKVNVPGVVIGAGGTEGGDITGTLMNMVMLNQMGITKSPFRPVSAKPEEIK